MRQQKHIWRSTKKRGCTLIYTGSTQKTSQYKHQTYTRLTYKNKPSYPQGRASKKSKLEGFSIFNEAWDHSNNDLMKNFFSLWSKSSSLLKILWLCSFQIHQNKQIGATCQTILLFLSSSLNFHSRKRFFTETRNTHFKLKTTNKKVHSTLVLSQWIKIRSIDSSLSLQRMHLLTMDYQLFINIFAVKIFPQTTSHAKKKKKTL